MLALKESNNPQGQAIKENLRYVLTTDWDYQPVIKKVVQFGLQMAEEPFFSNRLPVTATPKPEGVEKILPVPVSGKVVKGFGMIIDPLDNMERFHCGIDIAASVGAAVKAVQDGKVKQLGNDPVLGRFILPEHIPGDFSFMAVCRLQWLKQGRPSRPGRLLPRQGG